MPILRFYNPNILLCEFVTLPLLPSGRIVARPHDLSDNLVAEFVHLGRQFFGGQVTVPILLAHRSVGELLQDLIPVQSLGVSVLHIPHSKSHKTDFKISKISEPIFCRGWPP